MKIDHNNTDPAYWENILKQFGHLSTEDEQKGLGLSLSEDPIEQTIADKLSTEGEHISYLGSPMSFASLISEIRESLDILKKSSSAVGVAIHTSCTNGQDTVIVFQVGGLQHRFNTHEIMDYSRMKFSRRISKLFGLEIVEK